MERLTPPTQEGQKGGRKAAPDDGLEILLISPHMSKLLPLLAGGARAETAGGPAAAHRKDQSRAALVSPGEREAQGLKRKDSLLVGGKRERPTTVPAPVAKPLDVLNLWAGKRLTRSEAKVESRLHVSGCDRR